MSKNYFYNLLLSVVNILFPIITFPYASHIIGPEGIGRVQHALFFAESFAMFAALGIPLYGISAIAKSDTRAKLSRVFSELIIIHGCSGLLLSIVYFALIFTVPFFQPHLSLYATAGLIILLGFSSVDWFYSGLEKFKLIAFRSVVIKLVALVLLFVFVKTSADFLNYLCILIFSLLGNNLISLFLVHKHTRLRWKGIRIKRHFKPVLLVLGSNIAINIYAIWDTLLLGFLTNDKSVGLYFAAVKLVKFSIPFIISLGASLIPTLTLNLHQNNKAAVDKLLSESFHFIIFLAIPITIGSFLLAPEFIGVLSGNQFEPATSTMQIVSVLPLLIGLGHFFSLQILVPAGLNKQMLYATLAGVVCSVALNLILVPALGFKGAGIANIIAELVVTSFFYYYVSRHFSLKINWNLALKALSCSILFLPIVLILRFYISNPLTVLMLSVACCGIEYAAMQWLLYQDKLLRKMSIPVISRIQHYFLKS